MWLGVGTPSDLAEMSAVGLGELQDVYETAPRQSQGPGERGARGSAWMWGTQELRRVSPKTRKMAGGGVDNAQRNEGRRGTFRWGYAGEDGGGSGGCPQCPPMGTLAEKQKGWAMCRAVGGRWGGSGRGGVPGPGGPEGLGGLPEALSHLGVQFGQLLLIQVGLFVNSGLVPELRPGWGAGRDGDWASGPGEEVGPHSGLRVRVERAQPQLGGQRGAAPSLWGLQAATPKVKEWGALPPAAERPLPLGTDPSRTGRTGRLGAGKRLAQGHSCSGDGSNLNSGGPADSF